MGAYLVLYPRVRVFTLVTLGFFITTVALPAWAMLVYWMVIQVFERVVQRVADERRRRRLLGPHRRLRRRRRPDQAFCQVEPCGRPPVTALRAGVGEVRFRDREWPSAGTRVSS